MSELNLNPEVLVIGAGPGGAAAAWKLASSGHDILMVDKADFPRDKTCGDGLTPMAVQTLNQMSVLDQVLVADPAKVNRVRIRGGLEHRLMFLLLSLWIAVWTMRWCCRE